MPKEEYDSKFTITDVDESKLNYCIGTQKERVLEIQDIKKGSPTVFLCSMASKTCPNRHGATRFRINGNSPGYGLCKTRYINGKFEEKDGTEVYRARKLEKKLNHRKLHH